MPRVHRANLALLALLAPLACDTPPAPEQTPPLQTTTRPLLVCGNLPEHRPPTHGPIFWRYIPDNMFLTHGDWRTEQLGGDPATVKPLWVGFIAEQQEDQVQVVGPGGFAGENILVTSMGALRGLDYYGSTTSNGTPFAVYGGDIGYAIDYFAVPWADEALLSERVARHQEYVAAYGDILPYTYLDFHTQLYGHHIHRTGFWNFWDHLSDYPSMLPVPPPEVGDPYTWLTRSYDDTMPVPSSGLTSTQAAELAGLSFEYGPVNPVSLGDNYRYNVSILTEGWAWWWSEAVRWNSIAGARLQFFDNVMFKNCWGDECRAAYLDWLAANYTPEEIAHYHTETTSYMPDHDFEGNWFWTTEGWKHSFIGDTVYSYSPDVDASHGLYSLRLDDPGIFVCCEAIPPPNTLPGNFRVTLHYKMEPGATANVIVRLDNNSTAIQIPPGGTDLDFSDTWTPVVMDNIQVPAGYKVQLWITTTGGRVWFDDLWLTDVQLVNGQQVFAHPQFRVDLKDRWSQSTPFFYLLSKTSAKFWDSLIDDRLGLLRDVGRQYQPDFDLFTNSGAQRRNAFYFMSERGALEAENGRTDVGYPPGYYPSGTTVSNLWDFKYIYSKRFDDEFAYMMRTAREPGALYAHNHDSAHLQLAELAAAGAGAGGEASAYLASSKYSEDQKLALRRLERDFFKFLDKYWYLYDCMDSVAEVGLLFHDQSHQRQNEVIDIGRMLERANITYDVITEERATLETFSRYRLLVVHDIEYLSEAEALELITYASNGGVLVLGGLPGLRDELTRLRSANETTAWPPVPYAIFPTITPYDAGKIIHQQMPLPDAAQYFADFVRPNPSAFPELSPAERSKLRITEWYDGHRAVVHLLNYGVTTGKENAGLQSVHTDLLVRVPLPAGLVPDLAIVRSLGVSEEYLPVTVADGFAEFRTHIFDVYSVAELFDAIDELPVPVDCEVPNCFLSLMPGVLENIGEAAQAQSHHRQWLALFGGGFAQDITAELSGAAQVVLRTPGTRFAQPAEGGPTAAIAVPPGFVPGGTLQELIRAAPGIDAVDRATPFDRTITIPADPTLIYSAAERALYFAGSSTVVRYQLDTRAFRRLGGPGLNTTIAGVNDLPNRRLLLADASRTTVRVVAFDLATNRLTELAAIPNAGVSRKIALAGMGDGSFALIARPRTGATWEAWRFTASAPVRWIGYASGTGALLDHPLAAGTSGALLPLTEQLGTQYRTLSAGDFAASSNGPARL